METDFLVTCPLSDIKEIFPCTYKFGVSTRMKIRTQIRLLSIACGVLIVVYLVAFVWRFDVLGAPVRDGNHGWLGPPIRGNSQIVDIGKVYYYEGTDGSLYRSFRPLCRVWLWVNGF